MKLYIGLMSGTSMDGIDAALVDVENNKLIAGITRPYSAHARTQLNKLTSEQAITLADVSQLNTLLGREFAAAVNQLMQEVQAAPCDVVAIGSHGQTVCHDAIAEIPYTMQLGCPHTISALTNMTVVADFRTRDLVLGGKGAPYAPIYHQILFSHLTDAVGIVNIGGIANISYLMTGQSVSGYDVGPGNCLMDAWTHQHLNQPYDKNGEWAAGGHVIEELLTVLLKDAYFHLPSPKSIGKEYFSLSWLGNYLQANYQAQDVQATLLALTVKNIVDAMNPSIQQIAICGGGAHNQALLQRLKSQLPAVKVDSTGALGINPDFIEAMMFAWLAEKTLSHTPLDLSQITGAQKPAILGAIYPIT